ncbi:MAG: tRNA (adenosine(37)-N6)-threonylcarbamoyltransferase complex dimerization subunit type 1 TsaB [Candidatus Omnitrophica bacterium]|nr:tRNA (adenosine(37)-N6)-threonylcarbamoyltransferase complex dimerization subunit type 1 TsaB [Candidatus Omnitrophota bacterium]
MKLLLLDTSTKNFSLAVSSGDRVVASKNMVLKKVLSSSIIPSIEGILKKAGIALNELDGFAVGLGPGSFTSLRVGVATVKGLAFALNKPVVGVSSLDIIAMGIKGDVPFLNVISDAKRDLLYACSYTKKDHVLERLSGYLLLPVKDILKKTKEKAFFTGDGITILEKENLITKDYILADEKCWYPQAKNLLPLVLERFKKKNFDDIDKLVPLYLYPEDCQVKK